MNQTADLTEKTLSREEKYQGSFLSLHVDQVQLPNGRTSFREVVEHVDGVAILALDDRNNVLTVTQYRYVIGKTLLEIPAGKLEPGGLLERVKEAKTVILVSPRLELLRRIASGDDGDPLSHLLVRAILWQKDVRVYLDYEPPRFRRNTFLADTAEAIDTLRQMAVTVCPYFAVAPQEPEGTDLVTEADVLDAAKTESKTIRCRSGAIITPAARDALAATDVILRYEGETTHAAS